MENINDETINDDISNEDSSDDQVVEEENQASDDKQTETEDDSDDKQTETEDDVDDIRFEDEKEADAAKDESYNFQNMRKRLNISVKQNKELRYRIQQIEQEQQQKKQLKLGPKPTLASCEYDEDLFHKKNDEWYAQNDQIKRENDLKVKREQEINENWNKKLNNYRQKRDTLNVKDYELAESTVEQYLNDTQQGIIIGGLKEPAMLVYALGKNPERTEALSKIKDPMEFAIELGRLESSLKVSKSKRKPKTAPERTIKGTGHLSGSPDENTNRYRRDAEKTNDYTKVHRQNMMRKRKQRAG